MNFTYAYPRPAVTVDVVAFSNHLHGEQCVLLIRRKHPPFQDFWALPGGFIDANESPQAAARREFQEETGVELHEIHSLGAYGDPGRDPRGWTITIAFYAFVETPEAARGGDDAAEARWFSCRSLPPLAFDHARVVADALTRDDCRG